MHLESSGKHIWKQPDFLQRLILNTLRKKNANMSSHLTIVTASDLIFFSPDHLGLILIVRNSVGAISVVLGKVSFESQVR